MPHSIVLNFVPQSGIPKGYLTGKHVHGLFLTLVNAVDPDLAAHLHAQKVNKGFTLSPVQSRKYLPRQPLQWEHPHGIPAGKPCWWRVSLLDDQLFGRLTQLWLHLNPEKPWHLGPANLLITSMLATGQKAMPWAHYQSYEEIFTQASDENRFVDLMFYTPTTFRQGDYDSALPNPETVFRSLWQRWQQFSGIPFPEELPRYVFPCGFDLRSYTVMDDRSKLIGCVGAISYKILGTDDPFVIKCINSLADFALYAGVGRKTPMGMGVTRRIQL